MGIGRGRCCCCRVGLSFLGSGLECRFGSIGVGAGLRGGFGWSSLGLVRGFCGCLTKSRIIAVDSY